MERIESSCLELYILCKGLSKKKLGKGQALADDPEYKKLSQADILTMLTEIETYIDRRQTKFKQYQHKVNEDKAFKQAIEIVKKQQKEEGMAKMADMAELERIQRQEDLNKKSMERTKFQKIGKMMMQRMSAPKVEKVEIKEKEYTPFEQDMIDYDLGDILDIGKN